MTIKELIKELQEYDENMKIVISSDEEGNEYNYLYEIGDYKFDEENKSILCEEDIEDLIDDGWTDEDFDENDYKDVIVLWP